MTDIIDLKHHQMSKRTFKTGIKEAKTDFSFIKEHKSIFIKLFLFIAFINFVLEPILKIVGFGELNTFITMLIIPAVIISSLQQAKGKHDKSIFKETVNKLMQLRIYMLLFFMAFFVALSVIIPFQVIINDIGLTTNQIQNSMPQFLAASGSEESLKLFLEQPQARDLVDKITNMNISLFVTCWIIGSLGIILTLVNGFLALMQILTLSYISLWDSVKMAFAFNFKNGGYFIGKTMGILLIGLFAVASSLLGQFFTTVFESATLLYTTYVFYMMIDDTIEEKELD